MPDSRPGQIPPSARSRSAASAGHCTPWPHHDSQHGIEHCTACGVRHQPPRHWRARIGAATRRAMRLHRRAARRPPRPSGRGAPAGPRRSARGQPRPRARQRPPGPPVTPGSPGARDSRRRPTPPPPSSPPRTPGRRRWRRLPDRPAPSPPRRVAELRPGAARRGCPVPPAPGRGPGPPAGRAARHRREPRATRRHAGEGHPAEGRLGKAPEPSPPSTSSIEQVFAQSKNGRSKRPVNGPSMGRDRTQSAAGSGGKTGSTPMARSASGDQPASSP